jgi:hypothetical protein
MYKSLAIVSFVACLGPAQAAPLYDFVVDCKAAPPPDCLERIRTMLDEIRVQDQGRVFCLPKVWHPASAASESYPISLLDYLLLRLSAARIGRAGDTHTIVARDVLAEMYPCRHANR